MLKRDTSPMATLASNDWFQSLVQPPSLSFGLPAETRPWVRLIRLDEINEERHQAYRQALANVYATLDPTQSVRLLYVLDGGPDGVALYFGVVADAQSADLHEAMKNLRSALEGQLPGIQFGDEVDANARNALIDRLCQASHQGVMLGAPTGQEQDQTNDEQNFQGLDRLVRAMQSSSRANGRETPNISPWQLTVISQPLQRQQIRQHIDNAYALSSQLAAQVRTSVQTSGNTSEQKSVSTGTSKATGTSTGASDTRGKSSGGTATTNQGSSSSSNSSSSSSSTNTGTSQAKTDGTNESRTTNKGESHTNTDTDNTSLSSTKGSSIGVTQEIANKRAQHLMDYLDKQLLARLQKGLTKGLFHSAVYLTAGNNSTYQRLKNTVRATFQGAETTMSPLEVHDLPASARGQVLRLPTLISTSQRPEELLFHSLRPGANNTLGSLLTADELAIVASLPQQELQGIRRRKTVNFIVDLPGIVTDNAIDLGAVIDHGRRYPNNRVRLQRNDLNKHVFVTGVTGSGKTTTCLNLLLESGLPFLVIEPAKTEYRELVVQLPSVDYYRPNGDDHQSLRINPFALIRKSQRIKSHAGFLKNVFAAIFPMEASMPMMVEAAILASYENKGWDIDDNEFLPGGDPFDPISRAWPTMSEMIGQLDRLIPTYGLGQELTEKYRGSLVSRLRSLTDGTLGQVLDVPQSLCFRTLLKRHAVIELEELQGGEEKALVMALLLGGINESIRAEHAENKNFRHLTLIEEAHRLLSRPEPGDKAAAMAVEAFADMLAEVRKYGAGLIIADQIPAKLIPDIIKNTHSKIVHRLFAEDDRRAMGEAMMMDDEQRAFLPNLGTGEAVIFCGGWHGPTHAAIRNDRANTDSDLPALDISACGVQQLWRERARYYPQFCSLGWLSQEGAAPAEFAQFVRHTKQAQNQLLLLIGKSSRTETAFTFLKQWLERWQHLAQAQQAEYAQRRSIWTPDWPESLLAGAWMALLLDANPRSHAEKKDVHSFAKNTSSNAPYLAPVCDTLLQLLADSTSAQDRHEKLKAIKAVNPRNADKLSEHFTHLCDLKKI